MSLRIQMFPQPDSFHTHESGIRRVVEAYARYLPRFDVEIVGQGQPCDLIASHAGVHPYADVCHCHGMYWTADYEANAYEWAVNQDVITSLRSARAITVPSAWVAETLQRDMRLTPTVIPHGIEWNQWQHSEQNYGYVLWNKNRGGADVCNPEPIERLAERFPSLDFITTFASGRSAPMRNLSVIGLQPHDAMQKLVQRAGVYLSSTKETFGIGILEAMAAGIPVLGFAHGGNLDLVVHGVTGYLARPRDYDDLAAGLDYCLSHRKILGANGREIAKKWTWEAAVCQVAEVYRGAYAATAQKPSPLVTVVIPCYNYADKVGRAIESVKAQTFSDFECIVVDDGSSDGSAKAARKACQGDKRFKVIRQENQGVAEARNNGIAAGSAPYVCCLDADDAIEARFLEACVQALDADRMLSIAYTGLTYIKPDGSTGLSPWPGEFNYDEQLRRHNQIPTCCLYRRVMWERLGGYKGRYAPGGAGSEDAEFFLRAGAYGFDAKKVTDAGLFIYSWLSGRVSGNHDYREVDWTELHPWTKDGKHPFASVATPVRYSHPVRQYDEPEVSVIIPVGAGHERQFDYALDSLESQTFRTWEAIVVNDSGDPDDLSATLRSYPYARIVNTGGKLGAGAARNRGAKIARAPLLLFLDADDWLYPNALKRLLDTYYNFSAIVYCDYVGKAIIDPAEANRLRQLGRLLSYDEATQQAVIQHKSAEYEPDRACRQPDPADMFIWNLITSLTPKAAHDRIGGFDESMSSWEDWDYWIRLARDGQCFTHLDETLVVYRFTTGNRRESGLHDAQNLIKYLQGKYKGQSAMCGCKGQAPPPPAPPSYPYGAPGSDQQKVMTMPDDNFVLVHYEHPNLGQHRVVGTATRIDYGYRGGGETFYVDRRDIAGQPSIFRPVPDKPPLESTPIAPPEAPQALAEVDAADPNSLDLVPGITPAIATQLNLMGYYNLNDLLGKGENKMIELADLVKMRGLGPSRASLIMEFLEQKLVG